MYIEITFTPPQALDGDPPIIINIALINKVFVVKAVISENTLNPTLLVEIEVNIDAFICWKNVSPLIELSASNAKNKNSFQVNGYLNLFLNNSFNNGETIILNWKNNGNEKTTLNLNIITPYIFRSKISPSASFNIYKQDSSYVNTTTKFKVKYDIDRSHSIGSIFNIENSNISSTTSTNNFQTFNKTLYGLSYNFTPLIVQDKNHFLLELDQIKNMQEELQIKKIKESNIESESATGQGQHFPGHL